MKHILKHIATALLVLVGIPMAAQVADTVIIENETINTSSDPALLHVQAGQSITIKPTTWIQPGTVFSATISEDAYIPVNLNSNENYVFTRAFQAPITETELNDPAKGIQSNSDVIESITYFDGLGRPKQQIGIKTSPNKKDIVTHISYDDYGRQDKQYLPFERENDTNHPIGSYTTVNINNDINSYYQNKYATDFAGVALGNVNAYSESIFEPSPLNRVLEQGAPGTDWKADKDVDTDHTIKFDWGTNATNEVVYFKVEFPDASNTEAPTLVKEGYYMANELHVTITKDENWKTTDGNNHSTKEYKDKLGRVILKRTYTDVDTNNDGTKELAVPHDTYYVYDNFGNLTYVIPPKVTLSATDGVSPEELSELCYQYKYDYRNRLVEKKIPGKGLESIVYDKLDRPVLTQDANQAAKTPVKEWLFTKYDALGRVVYTGIYKDNKSRVELQKDHFNVKTALQNYETKVEVGVGYDGTYYTNANFPNTNLEVLTVNYYDNYYFNKLNLVVPTQSYEVDIVNHNDTDKIKTRGLSTGSKVKVLDTNDWITTITGYDHKARPIYIVNHNAYLNTKDIAETKLDFVGKVLESKTTHTKDINTPIVTIDTFTYDHMGRLLDQTQKINTQTPETIVANTYDALGQLETKEVGGGLQEVDYTYNVRGWLKNINNDSKDDHDLFNFNIKYNDITDVTKKLYNGNISQTQWSTENDNQTTNPVSTAYTYSYDALNRITSAIDNTGNYNLTSIGYDKNGNILNLQRNGHTNSNATSFGVMDNLGYTYGIGNQLENVVDSADKTHGFKDGTNTDDDYTYDINGNMIVDKNKGIQEIKYNHLNLPAEIKINYVEYIRYKYDALGNKLEKTVSQRPTTYYAGNFVYELVPHAGEFLKFINTPEGYLEPKDQSDLTQGFDYVYQYMDHLGNIRLSYSDSDNDGKIDVLRNDADVDGDNDYAHEILEENSYYPFGMKHKGYNNLITSTNPALDYKYNGKEFNQELGLDWYDYGARNYDASIGRWMNIDPLAADYFNMSPYNYTMNNPIIFVDPDGMRVEWAEGLDADEKELLGYAIYTLRKNSKQFDKQFSELHSSKMKFTVGKNNAVWGLFDRPLPEAEGGDEDEDGNMTELTLNYNMQDGAFGGKISVNLDMFRELEKEVEGFSAQEEAIQVLPEEFSGAALFLYYGTKAQGNLDNMPEAANIEFETKLLSGIILNEAGINLSRSQSKVEQFGIDYAKGTKTIGDYFNALKTWHTDPNTDKHYRGLGRGNSAPDYLNNSKK